MVGKTISHYRVTAKLGAGGRGEVYRATDGSLRASIPDPDLDQVDVDRISGASGITAEAMGTIYAVEVGPRRLRKYILREPLKVNQQPDPASQCQEERWRNDCSAPSLY